MHAQLLKAAENCFQTYALFLPMLSGLPFLRGCPSRPSCTPTLLPCTPTCMTWAMPWCRSLPKNVERADFFRYMVILKYGGVYSDIDTECRQPLSSIIKARDTMVVGWENEFATPGIAADRWDPLEAADALLGASTSPLLLTLLKPGGCALHPGCRLQCLQRTAQSVACSLGASAQGNAVTPEAASAALPDHCRGHGQPRPQLKMSMQCPLHLLHLAQSDA